VFSYSNESVMLFAGIVQKAAGKPIDQFVRERYFAPRHHGRRLVRGSRRDTGDARRPLPHAARSLAPRYARAARGRVNGVHLVSESWMATSTANRTPLEACYGFLWWVVRPGCDGYHFGTSSVTSPVQGFFADGWGGNYVAVIPASRIVAIRTKMPKSEDEMPTRYLAFTANAAALGPRSVTRRPTRDAVPRSKIYTAHN